MQTLKYGLGLLAGAGVISFVLFMAFENYYTYIRVQGQLHRLEASLSVARILTYGIVDSVDISKKTLTVRMPDPYEDGAQRLVVIYLLPETYIARQTLLGDKKMYTGLSPQTPTPLADIAPGERVAVFVQQNNERFVALIVLVGNPL